MTIETATTPATSSTENARTLLREVVKAADQYMQKITENLYTQRLAADFVRVIFSNPDGKDLTIGDLAELVQDETQGPNLSQVRIVDLVHTIVDQRALAADEGTHTTSTEKTNKAEEVAAKGKKASKAGKKVEDTPAAPAKRGRKPKTASASEIDEIETAKKKIKAALRSAPAGGLKIADLAAISGFPAEKGHTSTVGVVKQMFADGDIQKTGQGRATSYTLG